MTKSKETKKVKAEELEPKEVVEAVETVEEDEGIDIDKLTDREMIQQILIRVMGLEGSAPAIPAKAEKGKKASRKMSKEEKDSIKTDLMAKGPYTKKQLELFTRKQLVMYCSALSLGKDASFGMDTATVIANIIKGQPKS